MSTPDAPWRVYLRDWVVVYTSDELEVPGRRECEAVYAEKYAGRVQTEDWRIRPAGQMRPSHQCLQLFLPNLKGEYGDRNPAADLLQAMGSGGWLVRRGSAEEQELLDYGKKMLPVTGGGGRA